MSFVDGLTFFSPAMVIDEEEEEEDVFATDKVSKSEENDQEIEQDNQDSVMREELDKKLEQMQDDICQMRWEDKLAKEEVCLL